MKDRKWKRCTSIVQERAVVLATTLEYEAWIPIVNVYKCWQLHSCLGRTNISIVWYPTMQLWQFPWQFPFADISNTACVVADTVTWQLTTGKPYLYIVSMPTLAPQCSQFQKEVLHYTRKWLKITLLKWLAKMVFSILIKTKVPQGLDHRLIICHTNELNCGFSYKSGISRSVCSWML